VKFWVKAPGYLGSPEQMKLVATTDPSLSGVIAGTVLWDGNDLELADYTEFVAQFTPLTSDKYYFAWHAYTATVADYIALDDVSIEVAPAEPLTLDATVTNESCAYMSDGSIVTTVTGGVAPYGYLWNTLETTSSLTNLSEGTYSVTVTDFASSVITGSWTVTAPSEMSVTGTYHNSCFGANNGSAELTAVSGVAPYNYLWSTGASTAAISNLAPGFYSYTVTDATICNEVRGMMNIMEVPETVLSATTISASCPTAADGSIDLTATGVSPFTYLWSNGANTQDIAGLLPGNYSVTVTNAEGCAQTGTYTVDVISAICNDLAVTGEVTGTECFNAYNNIVVAGGVSLFTVKSTGTATFIAGNKINFMPGTKVELNGHLIGKIYNGSWCPGKAPAMPAVVTGQEETAFGFEQANFTLYPNPTNGNFTLVQKGEKTFGTVKLEIYSMGGERVLTDKMVGEKKHEFRFSDVPAGLYFVKVVADDYVETIKLIKTR
jgi:hypothetical protein